MKDSVYAAMAHQIREWLKLMMPQYGCPFSLALPWDLHCALEDDGIHDWVRGVKCQRVFPELAVDEIPPTSDSSSTMTHYCDQYMVACPCHNFDLEWVKTRARLFLDGDLT
jgi:hypothetical protein